MSYLLEMIIKTSYLRYVDTGLTNVFFSNLVWNKYKKTAVMWDSPPYSFTVLSHCYVNISILHDYTFQRDQDIPQDHLDIPQNLKRVHHINDIMLIGHYEQETWQTFKHIFSSWWDM